MNAANTRFETAQDYDPYNGWTFAGLSGGSDNLERLSWVYSKGFLASVWRVWGPYNFEYDEFSTQSAHNWRPKGLAVSAPWGGAKRLGPPSVGSGATRR